MNKRILKKVNKRLNNIEFEIMGHSTWGKSYKWNMPNKAVVIDKSHIEKKNEILELVKKGENVVIIDSENEYQEFAKHLGGTVITINPADSGIFNPFLVATEDAQTIEEKEIELRKLLDFSDCGEEYARQILNNMSFLDDMPEWKKRATSILEEYANV